MNNEPENGKEEENKEGNNSEDDEAAEAEIAKLIKEEDINIVPEQLNLNEIDKLTGQPKQKGKSTPHSKINYCRLNLICCAYASSLLHNQH